MERRRSLSSLWDRRHRRCPADARDGVAYRGRHEHIVVLWALHDDRKWCLQKLDLRKIGKVQPCIHYSYLECTRTIDLACSSVSSILVKAQSRNDFRAAIPSSLGIFSSNSTPAISVSRLFVLWEEEVQ